MSVSKILENLSTGANSFQTRSFLTSATVKPATFFSTLTLEVVTTQNKHIIVQMLDPQGKIIKMFSWYLVKGTNVTTLHDLQFLVAGHYFMDIVDNEGNTLFQTQVFKEAENA